MRPFKKSLYWEEYEGQLITALEAQPLLPALREVLANPAHLDDLASDVGAPHGCLVGNTTAELVPRDADARDVVAHSYARFTQIVGDALRRAQASGEVVNTAPPEAQARMLLFLVQGFSLVSRAGIDTATSLAAVDALRA